MVAPISGAFDAQRRRSRTFAVVACIAALLFLVLGAQMTGFLQKLGGTSSTNSLSKGAGGTPSSLQKFSEAAAPSLQKMGDTGPATLGRDANRLVMPDDIRAWLEHLHQTEIARVDITNKQLADSEVERAKDNVAGGYSGLESALDGIDDPNSQLKSPVDGLARMIKAMHDMVADLKKKFDDYPAPTECVPIQAAYDQALGEEASELGDLGDHLAAGDVAKLQSMQGESTSGIDAAGAKTDRLVGEICDKYDTKKWFSINKDIGPGGVFAMPGF
jgi:hypothetical protein